MKNPIEEINWELLKEQKKTLISLCNEVNDIDYKRIEHFEGLINLLDNLQDYAVNELGQTDANVFGLKKYKYSVSTNIIWASFDYGEVFANSHEEAKKLAIIELDGNFKKANELLSGFADIHYNVDEIQIEEIE